MFTIHSNIVLPEKRILLDNVEAKDALEKLKVLTEKKSFEIKKSAKLCNINLPT